MKIKYILLFLLIPFGTYGLDSCKKHGITHGLSLGRFGDQILSYAQTRYVSYITSVPFLYRSFLYSDQLTLDYDAKSYEQCKSQFRHDFHIKTEATFIEFLQQIQNPNTPPTLYILDYIPSDISEWNSDPNNAL